MNAVRLVMLLLFVAGIIVAVMIPPSRSWMADQWALLRTLSAVEQMGFFTAAAGLLGISTVMASWSYLHLGRELRDEIAGEKAALAEISAELDQLKTERDTLQAADSDELVLVALTPTTPEAKAFAATQLTSALPGIARAFGVVLSAGSSEEKAEAAAFLKFADELGAAAEG